jgi:hypothetical protein
MIHDLKMHRKDPNWIRLARSLQEEGYAVLTFDLRGHGDSRFINTPLVFWRSRLNAPLRDASKRDPVNLDYRTFPAEYLPVLVQDIVAARLFLDLKHEKGEVNSSHLVVLGAGEGATLGAFWLFTESCRFRLGSLTPESRDVQAAVWLGTPFTLRKMSGRADGWLRVAATENGLPNLFVAGENDTRSTNMANTLIKLLQSKDAKKGRLDQLKLLPIGETGQAILRSDQVDKLVTTYLGEVVREFKLREYTDRPVLLGQYVWRIQGSQVDAKPIGSPVPDAIPLKAFIGR